jgi:GNAT superfamily N-acetyltransferase
MSGGQPPACPRGDFRVRRLGREDAEAYRRLRLQGLQERPEAFGADWDEERTQPLGWFADRLARSHVVGGPGKNGRLLGTAGLRNSESSKSRHVGLVRGVYVAPEARRKGLAAAMLGALIADSTAKFESIRLAVVADNQAAIRL